MSTELLSLGQAFETFLPTESFSNGQPTQEMTQALTEELLTGSITAKQEVLEGILKTSLRLKEIERQLGEANDPRKTQDLKDEHEYLLEDYLTISDIIARIR